MTKLTRLLYYFGFLFFIVIAIPIEVYGQSVPDLDNQDQPIITPPSININPSANQSTITFTDVLVLNISQDAIANNINVRFYLSPDGGASTEPPSSSNPNWTIEPNNPGAVLLGSRFINNLYGLNDCGNPLPDGTLTLCMSKFSIGFSFPKNWANAAPITPGSYYIHIIVEPNGGETNVSNNRLTLEYNVIDQPVDYNGGTCPPQGCAPIKVCDICWFAQPESDTKIRVIYPGGNVQDSDRYELWMCRTLSCSDNPNNAQGGPGNPPPISFNKVPPCDRTRVGSPCNLDTTIGALNPGTTYYFRYRQVIVTCPVGSSSCTTGQKGPWSSSVALSTTANRIDNPTPFNGVKIGLTGPRDVSLSWRGGNIPTVSTSYDLYWGTTNPPTNRVRSLSSTSYTLRGLNHGTRYYWKVESHSLTATVKGPTWSFNTSAPPNLPGSPSPKQPEVSFETLTSLYGV